MEAGAQGSGTCVFHGQPEVCIDCYLTADLAHQAMSALSIWQVGIAAHICVRNGKPSAASVHRAFHHHTCAAVDTLIAGIRARGPGKPVDMCDVLQVGRTS